MGSQLSVQRKWKNKQYNYNGFWKTDTSILVNNDALSLPASREDMGLDLQSCDTYHDSIYYGRGLALDNLRSPSQCTTVSSLSTLTAAPLDTKHKYHMFFGYHSDDKQWVEEAVQMLEAEPYSYICCYGDRNFSDSVTAVQNILCSIMLSQRIVLVLSPKFIEETWKDYEDTLSHVTSLSQRRQRLLPLVLHPCDMPESLRAWSPIDITVDDFWDIFLHALQLDGISLSDSVHTIKSLHASHSGSISRMSNEDGPNTSRNIDAENTRPPLVWSSSSRSNLSDDLTASSSSKAQFIKDSYILHGYRTRFQQPKPSTGTHVYTGFTSNAKDEDTSLRSTNPLHADTPKENTTHPTIRSSLPITGLPSESPYLVGTLIKGYSIMQNYLKRFSNEPAKHSPGSDKTMTGFQNGQVLLKLSACVRGFCRCKLTFDYEEVPETLSSCDIMLSRQEYADIVKTVGREDVGERLPWVFTYIPNLILLTVFLFWCVAFIMVILLYPDNRKSTLPVRLCIFTLPAICIVLGFLFRWKKLKRHKEKYSMSMFSRSIYMNSVLSMRGKPVIVSSSKTSDDVFHVYFMYFNTYECEEQVKLCLTHCTDEEINKLCKLVDVYTLTDTYLKEKPLASRLAVMMSSAYAINNIYKHIPHSLERRHTKKHQCLCQFVEEFLSVYIPCISQEANLNNLIFIFSRYLNCDLKPDPVVLQSLGINIIEA